MGEGVHGGQRLPLCGQRHRAESPLPSSSHDAAEPCFLFCQTESPGRNCVSIARVIISVNPVRAGRPHASLQSKGSVLANSVFVATSSHRE